MEVTKLVERCFISDLALASSPGVECGFRYDSNHRALHPSFSGWVAVAPDDDWHFYWASTTTCRNLFAVDSGKLQFMYFD